MMTYRDRAYCSEVCANWSCTRNVSPRVEADAERAGLPILFEPMRTATCGYQPVDDGPKEAA